MSVIRAKRLRSNAASPSSNKSAIQIDSFPPPILPTRQIKLSVIIPCFNGAETLWETLAALAEQKWEHAWEVIFVDNGSTDKSRYIAQSFIPRFSQLRIVDASARRGQPFALNMGVAAAQGDAVAFCDADDVVGAGWLAAMGNALFQHSFVASSMDIEQLNPSWVHAYRTNPQKNNVQRIMYPPYFYHAGGGTLGVRRDVYQKVGGFDESLPYLHDTDFCFRAQIIGANLKFVSDAVMHIRFRTNLKSIYRQACNYAEYNVILAKRYQAYGLPNPGRWQKYLKDWQRVFKMIRKVNRSDQERAEFLSRLGWQMGQLRGIVRHRGHPV